MFGARVIDRGVLGCIVTGYAKGGTTLLKDLLVQTTEMQSGFEGGLLLAEQPADGIPEPHCGNLLRTWDIGVDFIPRYRRCRTFEAGYRLVRELAGTISDRTAPLLDKTPQYMVELADVMRRAPGTPVVVGVRDPLHVLVSWLQLENPLGDALAWIRAATESLQAILGQPRLAASVYVVNFGDLIRAPDATLAPLQTWLGRWPRGVDPAKKCGMPYAAGGRRRMPRGIETDRHDMLSRVPAVELERLRRELTREVPAAPAIATIRSGPGGTIAGRRVRAA